MQQLTDRNRRADPDRCAAAVVDVGLAVARLVRAEMRRQGPGGLTVPQVRALAFVNADPTCSPSLLADYLMLSRPAVTRLLDGLVDRRLLTRRGHPDDRRRLQLAVTRTGRAYLDRYFAAARAVVAGRLAALPARKRAEILRAMRAVLPSVAPGTPAAAGEARGR
jgi:DNA-binding MarR family transcriptional regulator